MTERKQRSPEPSDAPPRAASVRLGQESLEPAILDDEVVEIARAVAVLGEERPCR
jgi:hypothetical protein